MGTEAKRASPSNDLISLTTTDKFELLLASTTNTNISVSWKNLAQYLRTLSLPPTKQSQKHKYFLHYLQSKNLKDYHI